MQNLILFSKGIIIGIGKIIPGLSGSIIMMVLGLYEKIINAVCDYFDDVIENTKFLVVLGSGILVSVVLVSKLIKLALNNHYFLIICFFIGLILGGIPSLLKEIKGTYNFKNIVILIFFFCLVASLSLINNTNQISLSQESNNLILLFIVGVIEAATMIIPGISGTAILMVLGLYYILLDLFSNLSNFSVIIENLKMIIPFLLGLVCGGLFFIKLMKYLLTNHKIKTYWIIIGLALSSVFLMFNKVFESNYTKYEIIGGIILLFIGYVGTLLFEVKFNR